MDLSILKRKKNNFDESKFAEWSEKSVKPTEAFYLSPKLLNYPLKPILNIYIALAITWLKIPKSASTDIVSSSVGELLKNF
jgi:hypothetical protein